MPQMMPINWMFSFFFFIILFMIFNILNYYIFPMNNSISQFKTIKFNNLTWKW